MPAICRKNDMLLQRKWSMIWAICMIYWSCRFFHTSVLAVSLFFHPSQSSLCIASHARLWYSKAKGAETPLPYYWNSFIRIKIQPTRDTILMVSFSTSAKSLRSSFTVSVRAWILFFTSPSSLQEYDDIGAPIGQYTFYRLSNSFPHMHIPAREGVFNGPRTPSPWLIFRLRRE